MLKNKFICFRCSGIELKSFDKKLFMLNSPMLKEDIEGLTFEIEGEDVTILVQYCDAMGNIKPLMDMNIIHGIDLTLINNIGDHDLLYMYSSDFDGKIDLFN